MTSPSARELTEIAANDKAYRVRAAALNALGDIKAPNAYDVLTAAVKLDSPDDTLRNGALEGLGSLADDRSVPLLLEWSAARQAVRLAQCRHRRSRRPRHKKQNHHQNSDFVSAGTLH